MSVEHSPVRRGVTPPGGPSTFDLLHWSDVPRENQVRTPVRISATNDSKAFAALAADPSCTDSPLGRPTIRMHQPAGGVSSIAFGEKLSSEEEEALVKRRPGSESKRKEMSGSGIFSAEDAAEDGEPANGVHTPVKFHQPAGGASQISFGGDTDVSPRKPTSLTEVAKQRELSGSQETVEDIHLRRPFSSAKAKELVGSNIFGPPPEVPPRSLNRNLEPKDEPKEVKGAEPAPRNVHTSVKVSNPAGGRSQILFGEETPERMARKVHTQKMAELSGNDIFKGDTPKTPAEKPVSVAKLREMSGSDIFADDKPAPRDCVGGIRKPPGGESSIALI